MTTRRLTCTEGGSSKFWEGETEGANLTVRFGKIGTAGQTKTKTLASAAAADKELQKLIGEKLGKGYVEEAGDDADEEGEGEDTGGAFRTYGLSPDDWYEGANLGHAYELRFARTPTPEAKEKIAALFEQKLAEGAAEPSPEPWLWSGPWAFFYVGEREMGESGSSRDCFGAMFDVFSAIDELWPVDEAIFIGAREAEDDEDERPSDGPEYPGIDCLSDELFGRSRDPALPSGKPDGAFEAAREKARKRVAKPKAKAKAKPAKGPRIEAGELEQAWMGRGDKDRAPAFVQRAIPAEERYPSIEERAGVYLVRYRVKGTTRVAWLRDGQEPVLVDCAGLGSVPMSLLRADGAAALLWGFLGKEVREATPGGQARTLVAGLQQVRGAAYAGAGLAVAAGDQVLLYAKVGDAEPSARAAVEEAGSVTSALGGVALVVGNEKAVLVFDARDGNLVEVGRIKYRDLAGFLEHEGKVYFRGSADNGYREVKNVAEVLQGGRGSP